MRFLLFLFASSSLTAFPLMAQQVVAPTPERVGSPRGENVESYNVVDSFELGYRFRSVGGNLGKYRSDVNFGNGIRLLASQFSVNSREGRGKLFDEFVVSTAGLGNDPYQTASLRLGKNRLYQYNLLWRSNEYFNPALPLAGGNHFQNTSRRLQDHDLVITPRSSIRLLLGYSRNHQNGPALTTTQLFDSSGDEFPLFSNIRRLYQEYRVGAEIVAGGFRFQATRVWENFREDTPDELAFTGAGINLADQTALTTFRRDQPYHGNTPSWRLALFRETHDRFAVSARFTHSAGVRNFVLDELALGQGRFGEERNRQLVIFGDARRPVTTGDLTLSIFPADSVTITNHTAFYQARMEGDSFYREFDAGSLFDSSGAFQFLGIRTLVNTTDLNVRPAKWISLFGGYRISNRRVRSVEQQQVQEEVDRLPFEQDSTLHAATMGIRLQPFSPVTVSLDSEIGRADRPFFPISERNYHALGARVQYKRGTFLLSALARNLYNTNAQSLAYHTYHSRNYGLDASWVPTPWLAFDASYSKIHLDTVSAIAFFVNREFVSDGRSAYISNLHTGNLGVRFAFGRRADLYLGYSRVQDRGDGRAVPIDLPSGSVGSIFAAAQVFPLAFESPLARLSIPISPSLRVNFGYQYYLYREEYLRLQNYRAHTGYASLLWSF